MAQTNWIKAIAVAIPMAIAFGFQSGEGWCAEGDDSAPPIKAPLAREEASGPCLICQRAAKGWNSKSASAEDLLIKIDPALALTRSCSVESDGGSGCEFARGVGGPFSLTRIDSPNLKSRRVPVSGLIQRALADQRALLRTRQAEVSRWNPADRIHFQRWFGTTAPSARAKVQSQIGILMRLNDRYKTENFRRASPPRPGVFAYVFPTDPSRIFLDSAFVSAQPTGINSRAGTITHEMSHFKIAGGNKDHVYGPGPAQELARRDPGRALENADNFEYYVETRSPGR